MSNNHVGEIAGIYKIVELMPYRHKDGHTMYKGICTECGICRIAKYNDLKKVTTCNHLNVGSGYVQAINWTNDRIRSIFSDMKQRCYNINDKTYRWYGYKGIKICDEWLLNPKAFEDWAIKNGYDDTLTIDRIDGDLHYCPENCRWVPNEINSKYKSTTSLIDVDGVVHTGKDWAKMLGLGENLINTYARKYGQENTVCFIREYLKNPNLKPKHNQSYYNLYLGTDIETTETGCV